MGVFKGWLYCFLWYSSILAGYAGLFCPLLPVLFISNKLYRNISDALFTFWQYYPTVLLEKLCGCEIQVSGDPILTSETSLLVMNHRTRTDWNFFWPTVYHCVRGQNRFKHSAKFVLKDPIRHIPGAGWVMQLACFIFIKRCWLLDKIVLKNVIDYFSDLKYKCCLLVFPEGTDFTKNTKINSDNYAKKNQLQYYDYVLHPRTTGFIYLTQQLLGKGALDAVYDLTLVYPDVIPQNEMVLLNGNFPEQVKVHLTRYPSQVIPRTEKELKKFLEQRWLEKEKTLREYSVTNRFLHGQILRQDKPFEMYLALVFWSLLPIIVFYFFLFSPIFRYIVLGHTAFLLFINFISSGFQNFEISLYNMKKRVLFYLVGNTFK